MHDPYQSKGTRVFMRALGCTMGATAVGYPVVNLLHGIGLVAIDPPWGLFAGIIASFFLSLAAVEMFTGHITQYAGEMVRALADRIIGKAGQDG